MRNVPKVKLKIFANMPLYSSRMAYFIWHPGANYIGASLHGANLKK